MILRLYPIFLLVTLVQGNQIVPSQCVDIKMIGECPTCPIPERDGDKYTCFGTHWRVNGISTPIEYKPLKCTKGPNAGDPSVWKTDEVSSQVVKSAICLTKVDRNTCDDTLIKSCKGCNPPVNKTARTGVEYTCPENYWLINGREYLNHTEPVACRIDANGFKGWQTNDGVSVTSALCLKGKFCKKTSALDASYILQFPQPKITSKAVTCGEKKGMRVIFPDGVWSVSATKLVCNGTSGEWNREKGKDRAIPIGSKVFCPSINGTEDASQLMGGELINEDEEDLNEENIVWVKPFLISFGLFLILALAIPVAVCFTRCTDRGPSKWDINRQPEEPWSVHWEKYDEDLDWDWQVVADFMNAWKTKTVEEKTTFLELGYWELGYKSTITQMLYLFEFMTFAETNHLVWRPMINFIIRLKRLAHPPFSDIELSFKFNSWIAFQGKKIMNNLGYYADINLEDDDQFGYLRYMGVFLMTLGNGGKTKTMFDDMDVLVAKDLGDLDNPMRAAVWANRIVRDEDLVEFEKIWEMAASADPAGDNSEFGSKMDHAMFALGHLIEDEPSAQMADFILKSKKMCASNIMWWFRGATERGSHFHLPFFIKNHDKLAPKIPVNSNAFYECLKTYCQFDQSSLAWNKIEELVTKNEKLAMRLNVPAYRRHASRFNKHYKACGEDELDAWFKEPHRAADIEKADYIPPPPAKVVAKPAN